MKIPEIFTIEGTPYDLDELKEWCRKTHHTSTIPGWKKEIAEFIGLFIESGGQPVFQKTSGTTGSPKEYVLHRESMIRSARRTLNFFKLKKEDRALLCLPMKYVAGKLMVVRALVGELDLLMVEPTSRPLKDLGTSVAFAAMAPLQVHESLKSGDSLSLIEKLVIGGGELNRFVEKQLEELEKPLIYESFGMTETYTHFALRQINGAHPQREFKLLEGVVIGKDSRECLQVDVPGVTMGTVTTNDQVEMNRAGDGFRWLGRIDNVINSGGIKINPKMLEEKLELLLGHPCLLLSEEDIKLGNRLVLMVEYGGSKFPGEEWARLMKKHLSHFEVPKRVVVVNGIPRNRSYKPDRLAARKLLSTIYL